MNNKVRALRIKHGISQRELAKRVGTSQQQIQRVETGQVAARLELATELSHALGVPLAVLFPDSKQALKRFSKEITEEPKYLPSNKAYTDLERSGIEADSRVWTILIGLRGHESALQFEVEPAEKRRLFRLVQDEKPADGSMSFALFETEDECVAVNLRELTYCHFLFDGPLAGLAKQEPQDEIDEKPVVAYISGNHHGLEFGVDADLGSPEDEDDEGQFRSILFYMETHVEEHDRFYFKDEDGEDVFLRAGDLALLRVPLWVIAPEPEEEDSDVEELATTKS